MKKLYTHIASAMMVLALGGLGLTSCSDEHMEEVNTDESKANTMNPNAQLTTALLQT